tara:strand:+ start:84 stop:680 length:597 start_codon:yes stop_codon:yes gene_type:complete
MGNTKKIFEESIKVKSSILNSNTFEVLDQMGLEIVESVLNKGKMLLCGNGGSAADAQHLVAEMLIRLRPFNNREGIPALTLAQDSSTITACGNDFGYDRLYERVLQSIGKEGDVLIVITTSGNSENIVKAILQAKLMGIKVFGFLGARGGRVMELCDKAFLVPSDDTGRIQESHITAGHALMEYIEDTLLEKGFLHLD